MMWALQINALLFIAVGAVVAVLCVWAFIDCLTRKADRFRAVGKLSKPAWLAITGIAALVSVLGIFSGASTLLTLAAAIAAGVYLADVRHAVSGSNGYGW